MTCFRRENLQEAHQLQLFKANQRLLLEWSVKQSAEMAEKGLPKTRTEADRLIVEHQDWKVSRQLCFLIRCDSKVLKLIRDVSADGDRRPRRAHRLCPGLRSGSDPVCSQFEGRDPESPEPAGGGQIQPGPSLDDPQHDPGAGPDPAGDVRFT